MASNPSLETFLGGMETRVKGELEALGWRP